MGTVQIDQPPNALELLIAQHDLIDQLIAQLTDARLTDARLTDARHTDARTALIFRTLADTIAAHAAIEETIFYPAVREKETDELVRESLKDHAAIKRELAELVLSELDDPRFLARLQILQAQLEHHARDQEEGVLFPHVRALMTEDELVQLGARMRALFEQLLTEEPALDVPPQVREGALHAR